MAGQPKSRAKNGRTPPKRNQRTRKAEKIKSSAYGELMVIAAAHGIRRAANVSTAEILQEVLDRAVAHLRFAASKVDELVDVDGMPEEKRKDVKTHQRLWSFETLEDGTFREVPNKWMRMEQEARQEVINLAGMMEKLGLAERAVRVEEAKQALVIQAIAEAAREAGIERSKIKAMGQIFRGKLEAAASGQPQLEAQT